MADHDATLSLLGLLTNTDMLKQRLAEFSKAESDAKQAMAKADGAKKEAESFVRLADETRLAHTAQINAAKDEHDKILKEAAERIRVGNEQAAELLRLRTELEERERAVEKKENGLHGRESKVEAGLAGLAKREAKLNALEQELNARAERMRQAAA